MRILVAGHDLRFVSSLVDLLRERGHAVAVDEWWGHAKHDEATSRRLVEWAEVIICEFCLGNAVWYTANKRPDQRLLVRFHRFEFETDYPAEVASGAVDLWLFAGPHFREAAVERFGWPAERCLYLPNSVDVDRHVRPKTDDARFTLGILGYHRRLKRLDLALDLLEALRAHDPRFRLSAKGHRPEEINWVWEDEEERSYFEQLYERIVSSELLVDAVEFEPYDDTVPDWFTRIGFVLSPSDVESFHLAAAEGMASRAVPLLRRREGVDLLFPAEWIFDDVGATAAFVRELTDDGWERAGRRAQEHIRATYGLEVVSRAWLAVVRGVTTELAETPLVVSPPDLAAIAQES